MLNERFKFKDAVKIRVGYLSSIAENTKRDHNDLTATQA